MKVFNYTDPKQALYKISDNKYRIVIPGGNYHILNKNETVVHLFCRNMESAEDIRKYIESNYPDSQIDIEEISEILTKLISEGIIKYSQSRDALHSHYSFNSRKVYKYLDLKVDREKIISLGQLELSMTNLCPFNCTYCSKKENKSLGTLSFEKKQQIVTEAFEIGANTLSLTGGEPLHPQVFNETLELVKYAHKLGYERILLLTSGVGIMENFDALCSSGLNEVFISYNMNQKFAEDKVRNQFVEEHIGAISKLRDHGIKVGVCSVLNQENLEYIEKIIMFGLKNKLNSIHFYPVMPVGGAKGSWEQIKMSVSEVKKAVETIRNLKSKYVDVIDISMDQQFLCEDDVSMGCEAGNFMVYVNEAGLVSACACSESSQYSLNDYSLEWIWQESEYFNQYRNNNQYSACNECTEKKFCINHCIIRQKYANKDHICYEYSDCLLKK